jgi:prepilin-type processing-associated H-X9-DG protein
MFGERETQICHSGTWLGVLNPAGVPTLPQGSENSAGFAMVAGYSYPRLNIASPSAAATNIDLARITTSFDGCGAGFSSNHPGGAHFAFADGGVRFVVNGVQWNYQATANPAGLLDHKLQNNGVYQRFMSINDKLPAGGL